MWPKRVLQVVTIMNRGGLETMLMNYYRQVDRSKIQFDFMVHRQERGDYDDEIEELGGKIYRMLPIKPGNYRKYLKDLERFFKDNNQYQVVHSHINENSGFVLKAANKIGVPCRIAHSHLADLKFDYKYPFRVYGRLNLKSSFTHRFACSKRAGEWLFGKKYNKEVKILNNAVDTNRFKYDQSIRKQYRNELGIANKIVIGHVGRFNPQKNHRFLIDIFKEVNQKNPDTVLLLIGDGYLKLQIEEKVRQFNLSNSVIFLGLRDDIPELMQAMDLFLFPSLFEGLPVVLVEAQASGLRCITSTGVTEEANITKKVEFLELSEGSLKWAEIILNGNFNREDNQEFLIKKGYDTSANVKVLEEFYLAY
ncbi:MAG: glycosyltransferase family 1 protein [Turicibacter sanguinis]